MKLVARRTVLAAGLGGAAAFALDVALAPTIAYPGAQHEFDRADYPTHELTGLAYSATGSLGRCGAARSVLDQARSPPDGRPWRSCRPKCSR